MPIFGGIREDTLHFLRDRSSVVRVARNEQAAAHRTGARTAGGRCNRRPSFKGTRVLTAHAEIAPLGWLVFAEQPLAEAFAPIYAALWRTVGLLLLALLVAVAAGFAFARHLVELQRLSQLKRRCRSTCAG